MKKRHLLPVLSLVASSLFAQVLPNKNYVTYPPVGGTREMIDNVPSALDIANNAVYISGFSRNLTTLRDYIILKYDTTGAFLWQKTFDYSGLNDRALAIAVDNSGNILITGEATSLTNGTDIITQKYNSAGTLMWSAIHNGSANGDDKGLGLATDNSGNVYVCGYSTNTGTGKDFTVIRYNSTGVPQYVYTKNGTANGDDVANAIAFFGNKLYLTGNVTNTGTGADIYTTRLNANNAFVNWSKTENGTANLNDQSLDIKVMGNDVMVCGGITNLGTNQDYFFGKYNASNGVTVFTKTYDGLGANDFATSLVLDASNTYAVTGVSQTGSTNDYHTVKYNNSGVFQWTNKYRTNTNALNVFPKIAVDNIANHFYVSGLGKNATLDGVVYQITPGGNQSWIDYHDGPFGLRDAHVDLSVDNFGHIYLASLNEQSTNVFQIALIRYNQTNLVYKPIDLNSNEYGDPKHLYFRNYGQILNTSNVVSNEVTYYTHFCSPNIYVKDNSFSIVVDKRDAPAFVTGTSQRVDVSFVGSNNLARTHQTEYGVTELNYFQPHCGADGLTGIKGATRLMTPNIYTGIDLHYFSNFYGLKLFLVAKPGSESGAIDMNFSGATSTSINGSGQLEVTTFMGTQTFNLRAYQVGLTLTPITLSGTPQFQSMGGDTYRLVAPTYNPALPLVFEIDQGISPNKTMHLGRYEWSTSFGGTGYDEATDVKSDGTGNTYWCGMTNSANNFPTGAAGTNSFTFSNGFDAFVAVFGNATGFPVPTSTTMPLGDALVSMTYYGGSSDDKALAISVTGNETFSDIFITGHTNSTNFNVANKFGYYNHSYSGGKDAFIVNLKYQNLQMTPFTISQRWSTYVGGTGDDEGRDIKIKGNDIYICGITNSAPTANSCAVPSDNGFPICSSAFQSTNQGLNDGFILRLNNSTPVVNSTYIGGSQDDEINEIQIASNDDVFFAGTAGSNETTLPPVQLSGGYNQIVSGGGSDAIFGRISVTGNHLSYYGGSSDEQGNTVQLGASSNYFIGGNTKSTIPSTTVNYCNVPATGEFPLCPKAGATTQLTHGNVSGTATDGFLAEFGTNGVYRWGSYKGGNNSASGGNDNIRGLAVGGQGALTLTMSPGTLNALWYSGETSSSNKPSIFFLNPQCPPYIQTNSQFFTNNMQQEGFFGIYESSGNLVQSDYIFGHFTSPVNPVPDDVSAQKNAVHVVGDCYFFAGKTTNPDYLDGPSSGTAGVMPATQSPFVNSMTWAFNGPASYPVLVNYPPDATLCRARLAAMPMYVVDVGIAEMEENPISFVVYPNPSSNILNLNAITKVGERYSIQVTNMLGQVVFSEQLGKQSAELLQKQITVTNLSQGIYCITLSSETQRSSKLFVKE